MLEQEFAYFIQHQEELIKLYEGKFIVIKGDKVIGVYSTKEEAYETTIKHEKLGTFLIQECVAGKETYTQAFHSRICYQ